MNATLPQIIQGGMGVAVSSWRLAQAVSRRGQLGVVSGTASEAVVTRRLQLGDPDGDLRAAFAAFPVPAVAKRVWDRYYIAGGKPPGRRFRSKPVPSVKMPPALLDLLVVANFSEVFLAKRGHSGLVGVNLLEKIQLPNLASLFGAMLAGVDVVLMGAGIPRSIPAILDKFAMGKAADMKLDVVGALPGEEFYTHFDPAPYLPPGVTTLARPQFLPIVSSSVLAMTLARKSGGKVDGFIVEGYTAGGHNAPPRGGLHLDANDEPIYGERDLPNLEQIKGLGLPFWLAGSYGDHAGLQRALALGARGIQVGTAFAFSDESGMAPELRQAVLGAARAGTIKVVTDPYASPTGFPFKVVQVDGTVSEPEIYAGRERFCDLGVLRQCYRMPDGSVGYRCASEPVDDYLRKGGAEADTVGRKCVCNGLMSAAGYGQIRHDGELEPSLVTAGDEVSQIRHFLRPGRTSYSADDVIDSLLGRPATEKPL